MPREDKTQLPLPTGAELDILSVLWKLGEATVRQVYDALAKQGVYTTTLKQMQVMLAKGLLRRTERFGSHVYEAAIPLENTRKAVMADLLRRAFDGSAKNMVLGALSAKPVSPAELEEIRGMIDDFGKKKSGTK